MGSARVGEVRTGLKVWVGVSDLRLCVGVRVCARVCARATMCVSGTTLACVTFQCFMFVRQICDVRDDCCRSG